MRDQLAVTAIGSCRIANPMRLAARAGNVVVRNRNVYGYVHSTREIKQLLDYEEGLDVPAELAHFMTGGRELPPRSAVEEPDVFLLEISSLRAIMLDDWVLQMNYFTERFRPHPELLEIFADAARHEDRDRRVMELTRHPSYAALPEADRIVLAEARIEFIDRDELEASVLEIAARLPRPAVFVTHVNLPDARGRLIESRVCISEWLAQIGQARGLSVFDPTPHVIGFGTAAAMADEGASRVHYSPDFESALVELLLEPLRAAAQTTVPPRDAAAMPTATRAAGSLAAWEGARVMRQRAADQMRAGDLDGARATARRGIAAEPGSAPAMAILAQAALRAGDASAALDFALQAKSADPADAAALVTAAKALTKLKQFDEAAEMWLGAAGHRAGSATPFVEAARCFLRAKQGDKALDAATKALEQEAGNPVALAAKAEALHQIGRIDDLPEVGMALAHAAPGAALAIVQWLIAADRVALVPAVARALGEAQGGLSGADLVEVGNQLRAASHAAEEAGDWVVVGAALRALECLEPDNRDIPKILSKLASQGLEPARRAVSDGDLEAAERLYEEALRISPDHGRTLREAASVAEKRGDWARAAQRWERICSSPDVDGTALLRAGRASELAGHEEQALAYYGRAAAIQADGKAQACLRSVARRLVKRARAIEETGDLPAAARLAGIVRGACPDDPIAGQVLRRCEAHLAAQLREAVASGDPERQEDVAGRLLQLNPERSEALRVLARIRFDKGRLQDAADLLRRLTHVQSDVAAHWVKLGRCLRMMKSYGEAQAAASQALMRDPNSPAAQKILADVGHQLAGTGQAPSSLVTS